MKIVESNFWNNQPSTSSSSKLLPGPQLLGIDASNQMAPPQGIDADDDNSEEELSSSDERHTSGAESKADESSSESESATREDSGNSL